MEGGEQFTAKIPKGAKTGTKVRLRGKGGHGPAGRGDLLLVMNVHPDQTFERDGDNLLVDVSVDVVMSVLGGKVSVPTMSGPVKLTIPPGSQGGQTFRLKGRGMPSLRNKGEFGDLMATVRIIVPKELSEEERRLYEQLAELSENAASSDQ
jgi:DnaJ-class molecular chaperone